MQQRYAWVDYAKAIGIMLVVYGHVARGLHDAGCAVDETWFSLTDSVLYSFHMPLFFFLSGLFFYHSFERRGAAGLIYSKIDTIVYPYVVWSIGQGLVEATLSNHTNGNVSYGEVFALFWDPRSQFWFLYALFLIFVVVTLVCRLLSREAAAIALAASTLAYLYQSSLPENLIVGLLASNLVFFVFGMFFHRWADARRLGSNRALSVLALAFVVSEYLFHQSLGLRYTDIGIASLLLALVSILFVVSLSVRLSRSPKKWLVTIGASSMGIYLMHMLAGSGTRVLLKGFLGVDSFALNLLCGCVIGIVAPVVAVHLIARLKIPFVLSAPVSTLLKGSYGRALQHSSRSGTV